jgi:hypothetical protein
MAKLPDPLVPVLRKALAKSPEDRFASVSELSAALRASRDALGAAHTGDTSETATIHRALGSGRDRKLPGWALWVGIAVLTVVVVGLLAPATQKASRVPEPPTTTSLVSGPPPSSAAATVDTGSLLVTRAQAASPKAPREAALTSPPPATRAGAPVTAPSIQAPLIMPTTAPTPLGLLSLVIVPQAEVILDGSSLGVLASRQVPVTPGVHVVRVLHPDYEPLQRKITVREAVEAKLVLDLAEKGIRRRP